MRLLSDRRYWFLEPEPGHNRELPHGVGQRLEGANLGAAQGMEENVAGAVDPNDELKPLPGDKARIVRTREERIVGTGAGTNAGTGTRR